MNQITLNPVYTDPITRHTIPTSAMQTARFWEAGKTSPHLLTGGMMKQIIVRIVIGALLVISLPAFAQHRDGRPHGEGGTHREGHWRGHEIHRFGDHDLNTWRGGRWHHGRHDGRLGWWWIAAGLWYFYPSPVYPYPDPYTPPVTVINPQPSAQAPSQPQAQLWYYCDSAKGYYPYVPSCPEMWRVVPAQPPQAAPR